MTLTIGRRFELLSACAAREIPEARRTEIVERCTRWLDTQRGLSDEERFYMFAYMAITCMVNYCEQLQKENGLAVQH